MVNKQLEPICHHIALYKMYGMVMQHFNYFILCSQIYNSTDSHLLLESTFLCKSDGI